MNVVDIKTATYTPQSGIYAPIGTRLTIMGQNNNVPASSSTGVLIAKSGAYSDGIGGGQGAQGYPVTELLITGDAVASAKRQTLAWTSTRCPMCAYILPTLRKNVE